MRSTGFAALFRLSLTAALLAFGLGALAKTDRPAHAQDGTTNGAGTAAASISPADAAIYVGFTLDTESPQWLLAEELLTRAGFEDDLSDVAGEVSPNAEPGSGDVPVDDQAFLGGEAAVVLADVDAFVTGLDALSAMFGGLMLPGGSFEAYPGLEGEAESATDSLGIESATAGFVFVLRPGDIASATQQIEAGVSSENGTVVTESIYNGTTIVSTAENPATGAAASAYAIVGDFILISGLPEELEPFIDVAAGDTSPLSENDDFLRIDAALAGDRLGLAYLDGVALANAATGQPDTPLGIGDDITSVPGASITAGISLSADSAGFRLETVQIPTDGSTLEAPSSAVDRQFAGKVPADALMFANGVELGQSPIVQALAFAIASNIASQGFGGFDDATPSPMSGAGDMFEDAAIALGFNLQTELLEQLVGEYGFALWYADPSDPNSIAGVLTSGTESPDTVSDALYALSLAFQAGSQGDVVMTTREIGDATVNVLTVQQELGEPVVMEYGVVNGDLLVGFGGGIDGYLAGTAEPLAETDDFQAALAALPANYSDLFYVNVASALALAETSMGTADGAFLDNDAACQEYASQTDAQAALDADPSGNFFLDWDADGIACDDYFTVDEATPAAEAVVSPVRSFASVSYVDDGLQRTSAILIIAGA